MPRFDTSRGIVWIDLPLRQPHSIAHLPDSITQ